MAASADIRFGIHNGNDTFDFATAPPLWTGEEKMFRRDGMRRDRVTMRAALDFSDGLSLFSFLHAETHLERDLVVLHLAVPHVPTDLVDLEPLDVAQRLGCARDRGFDCVAKRGLGAADELGLAVDMIVLHGGSSVQRLREA
jgi:hypothetical protein